MAMELNEIKGKIEEYCRKKYAEKGVPPIFKKNGIIYNLELNEEEAKYVRHALIILLKEGKIVKYSAHTYRWNMA